MPRPFRLTLPRQTRSRRTLERIVAAGLAILEEEGPDAVTVQAVVARARSSVGSFYARFRGKEDLLSYLAEHARDSALAEWRISADQAPPSTALVGDAIRAAVQSLIDVRERWDAAVKSTSALADRASDYDAFRRGIVEELASRLLARRAQITHPNPDVAVRVGLWAVLGVLDHEGSAETPTDLEADALRQECVVLLASYLVGRHEPAAEQVDFFDVWS
jgi:AcrR family transcriptional regulator